MTENFIFGTHPVFEAIVAQQEIDKILIQKGLRSDAIQKVAKLAREQELYIQYVPIEKLNRITRKNHQGIIAFSSMVEYQKIENILPSVYDKGETPLILILDRITDVRNIGAIARTAECTGVHAILVPVQNSAQINAEAVKSSAGAILRVPIARSLNLKKDIEFLKQSGLQVVGVSEKTQNNYTTNDFDLPTVLIMGSEEDGVSEEYLKMCDHFAKIPMLGKIASLNVSAAAAVVLYETLRQRIKE
jgi:23S rRNA (guanosine2251-2'-O)-methyltransferase